MRNILSTILVVGLSIVTFRAVQTAGVVWQDPVTIATATGGTVTLDGDSTTTNPASSGISGQASPWRPRLGYTYAPLPATLWRLTIGPAAAVDAPAVRRLHQLSLTTHIAAAVAVVWILGLLCNGPLAPALAGSLFAIHPLQVQAVAYLSEFPLLLGAALGLWSLYFQLSYLSGHLNRRGRLPLAPLAFGTVTFFLALLCTPIAALTPALAWLCLPLLPKKTSLMARQPPRWPLLAWLLLASPLVILGLLAREPLPAAAALAIWRRPFIAGDALAYYLTKVILPIQLGPDLGRSPEVALKHGWGYATGLFPILLMIMIATWRSKAQVAYVAAMELFMVALLPFLGLLTFANQRTSTVASPYAYLALLGVALAVAHSLSWPRRRIGISVVTAMAVAALGVVAHRETGHWQSEERLWVHALDVVPASAVAHKALGDRFRREGRWSEARDHYQQALATSELSADVQVYLGEIERAHGTAAAARAAYERALALDPDLAEAHLQLGQLLLAEGAKAEASTHLREATRLSPSAEVPLRLLGQLELDQGHEAEAIKLLTRSVELAGNRQVDGATAATEASLGLALARRGEAALARQHLETALKVLPDDVAANLALAEIDHGAGRDDLARKHFERVLASAPTNLPALSRLGGILLKDHQYSRASQVLEEAVKLAPKDPEILTNLGIAYVKLHRSRDAALAFDKSLAIEPRQASPNAYLGEIARWQGHEQEAIAAYQRALAIEPDHVEANFRLGSFYAKQGKTSLALKCFEAALAKAPQDSRIIYGLGRLRKGTEGDDSEAKPHGHGGLPL